MNHRTEVVSLLVVLLMGMLVSPVRAEHRAALLIANGRYEDTSLARPEQDPSVVSSALQKRGFQCRTVTNLDEKQLRSVIEEFAATTPTLGTALIYFSGQVLPGSYKGKQGVCLLGTNSKAGRGFVLADAFESLHTRGGSSQNLIVLDSPEVPSKEASLSPESMLAYASADTFIECLTGSGDIVASLTDRAQSIQSTLADEVTLTGEGSVAIAPPDEFVLGKKAGDEWVNSQGTVFCWCPPGRYLKGSPTNEPGRYPDEVQEEVIIKDGFWIAKYELTVSENPRGKKPNSSIAVHKNDPLTMVNLDDARNMTHRTLTENERKAGRLADGWQYSLTTEEQWEYAARAGTTSTWYFGNHVNELPRHANFADKTLYDTRDIYSNAAHRTLNDGEAKLARVGSYAPNPWGIHDLHGNVAEWCLGTGIRGGSWVNPPEATRCAYRHSYGSRDEQNFIGYRLVIQKIPPEKPKPKK